MNAHDRDRLFDELIDKRAIQEVVMQLARGTDRLDGELIRSCYHPDGFVDHNIFRGDPEAFTTWVLRVLKRFAATMHFVGSALIELEPPAQDGAPATVARSETYCIAHQVFPETDPGGERDLVLGLRYVDRFERRVGDDGSLGRWLIAHRVCAFDWTYTVPITDKWAFEEHFTVGTRDRSDITYHGFGVGPLAST
jgi:SnoaL-like domain